MTAVFTNQACLLKNQMNGQVSLKFPGTREKLPLGRFPPGRSRSLKEVKVVPVHGIFEVHIILEEDIEAIPKTETPCRCISIDLGIENFAAIANNIGEAPILVRGNVIKSRNWWYNREVASAVRQEMRCQKDCCQFVPTRRIHNLELHRKRFFRDYFHKISTRLITYCVEHRIDTIIVGKNVGWKQKISMGKNNNRNFAAIPYEMFIHQLCYKAERKGIRLICQEESYTSVASFLDGDPIPVYGDTDSTLLKFSGQRRYRGLYVTKRGERIQSDINGACNIMKKAVPGAYDGIKNLGYLKSPVSWRYQDWYSSGALPKGQEKHLQNAA